MEWWQILILILSSALGGGGMVSAYSAITKKKTDDRIQDRQDSDAEFKQLLELYTLVRAELSVMKADLKEETKMRKEAEAEVRDLKAAQTVHSKQITQLMKARGLFKKRLQEIGEAQGHAGGSS